MAKVLSLFICPEKGQPMQEVPCVRAIAGVGLEGDRYATGKGTYSGVRHNLRHVTLIHINKINEANAEVPVPFTPIETRRNILVDGDIDLLALIGKEFSIAGVRMRGVEECTPCIVPSKMTHKEGFLKAYDKRGGLRAEILTDGMISVGSELSF